jgi:hypothetical protein
VLRLLLRLLRVCPCHPVVAIGRGPRHVSDAASNSSSSSSVQQASVRNLRQRQHTAIDDAVCAHVAVGRPLPWPLHAPYTIASLGPTIVAADAIEKSGRPACCDAKSSAMCDSDPNVPALANTVQLWRCAAVID